MFYILQELVDGFNEDSGALFCFCAIISPELKNNKNSIDYNSLKFIFNYIIKTIA